MASTLDKPITEIVVFRRKFQDKIKNIAYDNITFSLLQHYEVVEFVWIYKNDLVRTKIP
jgi:hypothetical protein